MILDYRTQKQLLNEWCWSAVTSSLSFYFNGNSPTYWTQSNLAAALINDSCATVNQTNASAPPTGCNAPQDITRSLTLSGNFYYMVNRALFLNEIASQINAYIPICCQIYWQAFNISHFITIYGYDGSNIIIGDPEAGIFSIDYNTFIAGYRGGKWIYSFIPKQP